jgi:hypothetical protein
MKIFKISSYGDSELNNLILRQLPRMSFILGDCKFIINADSLEKKLLDIVFSK